MANNNKHTGPNVPALRFPEFSGEWIESKLGDIADFSKGTGISKDQRSEEGNPCILYGELYTRYKSEVITNVFSKTALPDSELVKSKANDIIIPASGETAEDIATARCVPFDNILLGGDLNIIRLHEQDGKFFSYQLNGVRKYDIATVAQGVSVVHLHAGDLKGITVKYPSHIAEQEKISQILGLIDDRIATQSKIIEELTTLRSALLEKVFQVSNPTLEVGAIAHQTSERNKLCRYSNVLSVSNRFGFINQSEQFEGRNVASDDVRNYKVVHRGDFAYNPARINVGSIAMLKSFESGIVSPMYICFQVDDTIVDPSFFELFLETKAFKDEMEIRLEGSVRRCLSFEALCEIHLPLPALLVQRSISNKIGNISAKIKLEDRILRAYIRQKEWLLKQMFI